ncbi:MAG: putative signal transduction histidine kinase, partial [Proteobacteria bacterium]|nr:putative signal transduction histidine kinase [Pseudomonadota bacterium]
GAALAWENSEEPGCTLQRAGTLMGGTRHLAPGELDVFVDTSPTLFDRERQRMLKLGPNNGMVIERNGSGPALASFLGLTAGLSIPVEGTTGAGQIVLVGIPGLCRDHLAFGQALAREIAHGLDEEEISSLARETAAVRLRGNIARDLHDSVAQSLAGAGYRLASLRQQIRDGKDVLPEIDSISESLHAEQAHIREIIARLRSDAVNPGARNLGTELDRLANALSRHWQVEVRCEDSVEPLVIPAWLVFEIQQLVREGIANAVRHGTAKRVSVKTERIAGGVSLQIDDDGKGFPGGANARLPQSIAERVEALGGKMDVASRADGTRICITLPLGARI